MAKAYQRRWMIGRHGEKGSGISVLAARHDDDDDAMVTYLYDNELFLLHKYWPYSLSENPPHSSRTRHFYLLYKHLILYIHIYHSVHLFLFFCVFFLVPNWPQQKLRLKKSTLQLKQFDGTIIKTDTFEGTFETKNRFEIKLITVVACIKDHILIGIDVLKVDTSKLVNSMEEKEIGLLMWTQFGTTKR